MFVCHIFAYLSLIIWYLKFIFCLCRLITIYTQRPRTSTTTPVASSLSATPHDTSPEVMMQPPAAMAPPMCAIDVDLNADPVGVGDEGSDSLSGRKCPRISPSTVCH